MRTHYQKYLLSYEQKYFFGREDDAELPELAAGRVRKNMKIEDDKKDKMGLPSTLARPSLKFMPTTYSTTH